MRTHGHGTFYFMAKLFLMQNKVELVFLKNLLPAPSISKANIQIEPRKLKIVSLPM